MQPYSLMLYWIAALNIFVSYAIKMFLRKCLVKAYEEVTLFIKLENVMKSTNQLDTYTLRFLFIISALLLENI